jgi:hypothetical protein
MVLTHDTVPLDSSEANNLKQKKMGIAFDPKHRNHLNSNTMK